MKMYFGIPSRDIAAYGYSSDNLGQPVYWMGSVLALLAATLFLNLANAADIVTIAHTGQAGLTRISPYVSINDSGLVALAGETAQGRTAFVGSGGGLTTVLAPSQGSGGSMVRDRVHINNLNQVLLLRGTFVIMTDPVIYYDPWLGPIVVAPGSVDSLEFLQLWPADGSGGPNTVAEARVKREYDIFTYPPRKLGLFWSLGPDFCANNLGQVAFMADQGTEDAPDYALFTRETATDYVYLPLWPGARPALADDGSIVVRTGQAASEPIVRLDYLMNDVTLIAGPSLGFTALGAAPGISDDGLYIAFYGVLNDAGAASLGTDPGPGIFLHHPAVGEPALTRVAGPPSPCDPHAFDPDQRVVVNTQQDANEVLIAFVGADAVGRKTLYGSWFYANPGDTAAGIPPSETVMPPRPLVRQAELINGLGPFNEFRLCDSLNTRRQVALWASSESTEAAFKVTVPPPQPPVILVYGWHGTPHNWDVIEPMLRCDGYATHVFKYDDSLAPSPAAEALSKFVQDILDPDGDGQREIEHVDIIAHSYGGIVSRHFIEEMGKHPLVANLIMIATPNHGSRLADYVTGKATEQPYASLVQYFFDFYSSVFRTDRDWGSTRALQTGDDYLLRLNLLFGIRYPQIETRYFVIAGTAPYPERFTSHHGFLSGLDDGAVATSSARLPGVPFYCVSQNHSAILNPRVVARFLDDQGILNAEGEVALDRVFAMYEDLIDPILKGESPPTSAACGDGHDPNDSQFLPDILTSITFGIRKGDKQVHPFLVGNDSSEITVTFTHRFSEFAFALESPSGQRITPDVAQTEPWVDFSEGEHSMSYVIRQPEAGEWRAIIDALDIPDAGEELALYVLARPASDTPLRLQLGLDPDTARYFLDVTGVGEEPLAIEESPDLITWIQIATSQGGTNHPVLWLDSIIQPQAFYRARTFEKNP